MSGEGRGCNELTGQFEILEIVDSASGDVERFAATFEQHCEDMDPALTGAILFNSTLPDVLHPAVRCRGAAATVDGLLAEVAALTTSRTSKTSLRGQLKYAQESIDRKGPRLARETVASFSAHAVRLSSLR